MHRSGTSLVAQLLHALGLDLGPEEHLMRPSPANPTGHWENEPITDMNDEILESLGGTWSEPPELAAGWESASELDDLRRRARELIQEEFPDSDRWGFKDPRTSLTLPLWQRILPPMRYVICLRNPLDVAYSLAARDEEPVPFEQGVQLWLTYVRAALAATTAHPQLVVFYEDLMSDPEPAVRRLADQIRDDRVEPTEAEIRAAIRVAVSQSLWHHRTPPSNVVGEARLPFHVKALYLALHLFASGAERVPIEALDLLGADAVKGGGRLADLERRLSERRADLERIAAARRDQQERRQRAEAELKATREQLGAELKATRTRLQAELEASRAELETTRTELRTELEASRAEVTELRAAAEAQASEAEKAIAAGRDPAYQQLIDDVRERAHELLPSGATALVASKGDDELLQLEGCRGWHFPVGGDDGRYLGYHPAGDTAVIAQLEAFRARGADHLILPEPTLWWLDYYLGLRRHLEDRYETLLHDERCAIYRLRSEDGAAASPLATIRRAVASLRARSSSEPSILDWRTGMEFAGQLPDLPVFTPPADGDALPYLDRSVDVVVVASSDAARLAEARRVAAQAVIRIDANYPDVAELEWSPGAPSGWGENVSVTLVPDPDPAWEATLRGIAETLDPGFTGELTVVGAPSAVQSVGDRARVIEANTEASVAERVRAATAAVDRNVQVLVTAPAVPLPGWLPSIISLLSRSQGRGVVGARIVSRFGVLEEAGGVVAADGSRRRRGEGDQDPDRPEYCYVRRVDFCSPPLIATSRDLVEQLLKPHNGGAAPDDALIEFSLRAGQAGEPVYYQPQARVVRIGGHDQ
jgi:hypothetical protein